MWELSHCTHSHLFLFCALRFLSKCQRKIQKVHHRSWKYLFMWLYFTQVTLWQSLLIISYGIGSLWKRCLFRFGGCLRPHSVWVKRSVMVITFLPKMCWQKSVKLRTNGKYQIEDHSPHGETMIEKFSPLVIQMCWQCTLIHLQTYSKSTKGSHM